MAVRRKSPAPAQSSENLTTVAQTLAGRWPIMDVWPVVESGRRPAKAVVGEVIPVSATCFREGHSHLGVSVILRRPDDSEHSRVAMRSDGGGLDRWTAQVSPDTEGPWSFCIEAWDDPWATWLHRADILVPLRQDVELEFQEGAQLLERIAKALPRGKTDERKVLRSLIRLLHDGDLPPDVRLAATHDIEAAAIISQFPIRMNADSCGPWPLLVERRRALVGSWYEFFPRSVGSSLQPMRSGTFTSATTRLEAIKAMGFNVVYLPPIHPIGQRHRKGPNNSLTPAPTDPGSPWAIGASTGGHRDIHPELGDLADFTAFVRRAAHLGLEVALDLALQTAPDHPWVSSHPEWFTTRADGTIAYAENPPKKYQDIYPLNFDNDPAGLYAEVVDIVKFWLAQGVRIFRVDNPHTKPLWVWDQLIHEIQALDSGVIFLAEAFTRPPMMRALAKVGFQQSYTYFTWRNTQSELREYFDELAGPASAFMRPNLFVNTPDILSEFLQTGGPAGFSIRAALAATLSPTWGVYSGFEYFEGTCASGGGEEYLDSEKYQYRPRDFEQEPNLIDYITALNTIRAEHPPLQDLRSLRFHYSENDNVIAYSKSVGDEVIITVVTLDPHVAQESTIWWDMPALGLANDDHFIAEDLLTQESFTWGPSAYVQLNPITRVAHIVSLRRL